MKTASRRSKYPEEWWGKKGFPEKYPFRYNFKKMMVEDKGLLEDARRDGIDSWSETKFMKRIANYQDWGFSYYANKLRYEYLNNKIKINKYWNCDVNGSD